MTAEPGAAARRNPRIAAEESDVDPRLPLWIGFGSAIAGLSALAILAWIYGALAVDPATLPTETPPSPRLQVDDVKDMRDFSRRQAAILDSYGWVDPAHAVARLPIAEAMRLTATRGIADWPAPGRPSAAGPAGFKVPQGVAIPGMAAPATTPPDTPIPGLPQSAAPQPRPPAAGEPGDRL